MTSYRYTTTVLQVHKVCAVPGDLNPQYAKMAHFVKASPKVFGRRWFSNVAILGPPHLGRDVGEVWYAKVLLLFHYKVKKRNKFKEKNCAFVRFYGRPRTHDQNTRCEELVDDLVGYGVPRHMRQHYKYCIVKTTSILRAVHIVRSFQRDVYLLNKHLIW